MKRWPWLENESQALRFRPALLKESSEEQRKLGDTNNTDVTDAILEAIEAKQS